MNITKIKVWIIKKTYAGKYERYTGDCILAPRIYYYKLSSNRHPANKFRKLLKKHNIKFSEQIMALAPINVSDNIQEDYYVFTY